MRVAHSTIVFRTVNHGATCATHREDAAGEAAEGGVIAVTRALSLMETFEVGEASASRWLN